LTVTRGGHIAAVCFRLRSPPDLYFATHRSQGSWEAEVTYSDGSREILACVHKHWFKRDAGGFYYEDPWTPELRQTAKFATHVEMIRSKGRVILTTDEINQSKRRGEGFFKRTGYIGVYPISDFVVDDESTRFRFGSPIRPR
jgi:hypothetical protein